MDGWISLSRLLCGVSLHIGSIFYTLTFFWIEPVTSTGSEFLSLLRISEFFGFQWQKLAEILSLFKLYNNLGKVAVRVKLWLIIYCGHLVEWIVK